MSYTYRRQSVYSAALLFLISRKRYVDLAVNHGMAVNLEAEDQRRFLEERGPEVLAQWEQTYRKDYQKMADAIFYALWSAFGIMVVLALMAVAVGLFFGKISPAWPIDPNKLTTFIGSFLVGWATLMELGGNIPTWDGVSFPQLTHSAIFKMIFSPGVFLVLTSILL